MKWQCNYEWSDSSYHWNLSCNNSEHMRKNFRWHWWVAARRSNENHWPEKEYIQAVPRGVCGCRKHWRCILQMPSCYISKPKCSLFLSNLSDYSIEDCKMVSQIPKGAQKKCIMPCLPCFLYASWVFSTCIMYVFQSIYQFLRFPSNSSSAPQIWIYGNSFESFLVAVVVPERKALEDWASSNQETGDFSSLCNNTKARKYILDELNSTAKNHQVCNVSNIKSSFFHSILLSSSYSDLKNTSTASRLWNVTCSSFGAKSFWHWERISYPYIQTQKATTAQLLQGIQFCFFNITSIMLLF